jgi:RNA polymerase sigma-70 factor (ECF subfamily)
LATVATTGVLVKGSFSISDPTPDLIRRAQEGEEDALRSLLTEIHPAVRQWALAHTGDPEEAADLSQEVLILLVRKIGSYRGEARFLTWLFAVTRNQALEEIRRQGRQRLKMNRFATEIRARPASPPAPERAVDKEKLETLISAFMGELPPRQREVFQLADLQGLSSPEIGEILKMEAGSVRAALFKARRTLRRRILEHHPEFVEEYLP